MNLVVMGVAGSGKTTVGRELAARLGAPWRFVEGDDFHPPANIAKMGSGRPLDDADRAPWLDALRAHLDACGERGESVVLACSALKEAYRLRLGATRAVTRFVYLKADVPTLQARLQRRRGHYMKAGMLASQIEDLEEPAPGSALVIDAGLRPPAIVDRIVSELKPPRR